jgi:hypothetical protein
VLIAPRGSYTIRNLNADRLPVRLADNIHPWMTAWLWVFDHPYFAVTDVDGAFTIRQAPAGTFRLVVWHEGTGWGPGGRTGIDVTVPRGRDEVVPVELKPPEG